ncbi:hypothetical protein [Actinoallomurus sp. NPDC052274]|uniref:hypothetical protein n=1 Tax=Actinoallomurus sp. NPDC052274 TaxID=3155420 RepID=UPI0034351395
MNTEPKMAVGRVTSAAVIAISSAGLVVSALAGTGRAQTVTQGKKVTFFSARPMPLNTLTPTGALPQVARQQLKGTLKVRTNTPSGYHLRRGNRRTDYTYASAYVWAIEASCGSNGCKPIQQVRLQLIESLQGTTSKRWTNTMWSAPWSGPSYFVLRYYYQCGVNIKGARDKTCSTWKHDGADGSSSGGAYNGYKINRTFGSTNNVTKFPMVDFMVTFKDGSHAIGDDGHAGEKFRGWDACVKARSTKLCKTTGNGG